MAGIVPGAVPRDQSDGVRPIGARRPMSRSCGRRVIVSATRWLHRFAGRDPVGPWQRQRPHIGLVGGIGPVALVFHLEDVAFHPAFGA